MNRLIVEIQPLQIGKHILRVALLLLLILSIWGVGLHWSYLLLALALFLALVFTQTYRLQLYVDEIIIESRSLIPIFSTSEKISLQNTTSIEYLPGHFDKKFFLVDVFLNTSGYRGSSRPDTVVIHYADGSTKSFIRKGDKASFEVLLEELRKSTSMDAIEDQ